MQRHCSDTLRGLMNIERARPVDIRTAWLSEDPDLTPWLAEDSLRSHEHHPSRRAHQLRHLQLRQPQEKVEPEIAEEHKVPS